MPIPHYYHREDVEKIIAAAEPGRDRQFLLLLWRTGIRREEAVRLEWRDIHLGERPMLTVRAGKGGKGRTVPIHPELAAHLGMVQQGRPRQKVFAGRSGGGGISTRTASRIAADAIAAAKVQSPGTGEKPPGCHSLRHSAARHWLDRGIKVNAVSVWLGHSSPLVTLQIYLPLAPGELGSMEGVD